MLLEMLAAATLAGPNFDGILDTPVLEGALAGVVVSRMDGSVVYQRGGSLRLMPASNQKLGTCAYALERLGAGHTFAARFWKQPEGVFVDAGNPTLTSDQLRDAGRSLGVKPETPIFVRQPFEIGAPPSWEVDDLPFYYAMRITAFSVNRGRFDLWAREGRVEPVDPEIGVKVVESGGSGEPTVNYDPALRLALVSGKLPQERTRLGGFAIPNPSRTAAAYLGGHLRRTESIPDRAPDMTIESAPLSKVVADCLVPSDNHLAENLLLFTTLAGKDAGGSLMERSRAGLRAFLVDDAACDPGDLRPYDGSGMSRHNLTTARALARLLVWAKSRPWGQAFDDGLARPGTGTLRSRLQGAAFRGKTGSLDMVVGLSGYVTTDSGETLAIAILVNHTLAAGAEVRKIADQLVIEAQKTPRVGMNLAVPKAHARRSSPPRADARFGMAARDRIRGHGVHRDLASLRLDR